MDVGSKTSASGAALQWEAGAGHWDSPADGQWRCLAYTVRKPGCFPLENCRTFATWQILTIAKNTPLMLINAFCSRPAGISCIVLWLLSFGHQAYVDITYFSIDPWPYINFSWAFLHMLMKMLQNSSFVKMSVFVFSLLYSSFNCASCLYYVVWLLDRLRRGNGKQGI